MYVVAPTTTREAIASFLPLEFMLVVAFWKARVEVNHGGTEG